MNSLILSSLSASEIEESVCAGQHTQPKLPPQPRQQAAENAGRRVRQERAGLRLLKGVPAFSASNERAQIAKGEVVLYTWHQASMSLVHL